MDERTVYEYSLYVKKFLKGLRHSVPIEASIREYMMKYRGNANTYRNALASIKKLFLFLNMEEVVKHFKYPKAVPQFQTLPSKAQLKRFYQSLKTIQEEAVFLLLASSGIRSCELLQLKKSDIDFANHMVKSPKKIFSTKNFFFSFFNKECSEVLKKYSNSHSENLLFPLNRRTLNKIFSATSKKSEIKVTPKTLRLWFSVEMARKNVPDRIVDFWTGHVPRTILARHYSTYDPETLKEIYDEADPKVLS